MKHEQCVYYLLVVNKTPTSFLSVKYLILTEVLGNKNRHVCAHAITPKLSFDIQILKVQEFY